MTLHQGVICKVQYLLVGDSFEIMFFKGFIWKYLILNYTYLLLHLVGLELSQALEEFYALKCDKKESKLSCAKDLLNLTSDKIQIQTFR